MLKKESLKELDAERAKYPDARAALLPALYIAQKQYGWLSPEALEAVSVALGLPRAAVKGVASFYSMFKHKPMGRHLIQLCTNVSCMIFGSEDLLSLLKERYDVQVGGTTPDGRFSLVVMECIGACEAPPAMLVNQDFHNNLTEDNIFKILEKYK